MCTKILSCILCGQPNFPSVDALRVSLLKVTARPLKCPICGDELLGLDKLTIHLFGHSLLEDQQIEPSPSSDQPSKNETKRNGSFSASSFKSLRKVRKKGMPETEAKHSDTDSGDIRFGKISPAIENSQGASNANHCSVCDVGFRNSALLKMHREVFHDNSDRVQSGAPAARDGSGDKRFHCYICPKEFKMKGSLKIHMRVVHEESAKSIVSTQGTVAEEPNATAQMMAVTTNLGNRDDALPDPSAMVSLKILDQHQNIAVFQSQLSTSTGTDPAPESHIIQIIDPRQLAQVVYLPPNGDSHSMALARPMAQDSGVALAGKENFSLPSSPQHPQQGHENVKQWECDVCRKSFTTKYFLKKHNRLHTGEMPYTCGICNKSFTFQQSYHKHLLYHSDEKPHVCPVCKRAFKELSTLHNHQRIHSGEKPFACETCGKCFRQRVSYLVHRRIHTGLMPYKCSGCDKSFRYKVSQRTHKCPASPPGTVVRKTGDLLQKLLQSSAILPEAAASMQQQVEPFLSDSHHCHTVTQLSAEEDKQTDEYVNRTLEELVKGTYDKLDITHSSSSPLLYDHQPQAEQLFSAAEMASQIRQLPEQSQSQTSAINESSFPRIESLCLLSPSAFDSGQLEDLAGLKLDNGW